MIYSKMVEDGIVAAKKHYKWDRIPRDWYQKYHLERSILFRMALYHPDKAVEARQMESKGRPYELSRCVKTCCKKYSDSGHMRETFDMNAALKGAKIAAKFAGREHPTRRDVETRILASLAAGWLMIRVRDYYELMGMKQDMIDRETAATFAAVEFLLKPPGEVVEQDFLAWYRAVFERVNGSQDFSNNIHHEGKDAEGIEAAGTRIEDNEGIEGDTEDLEDGGALIKESEDNRTTEAEVEGAPIKDAEDDPEDSQDGGALIEDEEPQDETTETGREGDGEAPIQDNVEIVEEDTVEEDEVEEDEGPPPWYHQPRGLPRGFLFQLFGNILGAVIFLTVWFFFSSSAEDGRWMKA
ncbi:hypothetical protein B0T16DRAFT_493137 [Cercophora newfieldiana]|uniref:Uncharacterized protein n=1 Tax=Cercophora newfieldiana TaxID=92897 RepID=A0AA39Y4Y3_9PEZI|nr:hypothetical protein B0T16DRAFT_493137 [Cercophora newfieldiana]